MYKLLRLIGFNTYFDLTPSSLIVASIDPPSN